MSNGRCVSIEACVFHEWNGRVVDVNKEIAAIDEAKARDISGIKADMHDKIKYAQRKTKIRLSELSRLENFLQHSS